MSTKKIFSILLLFFGEAILIYCFLEFSKNLDSSIVGLNILVSTVIYSLIMVDVFVPWIDLKDRSQRQIGSIGMKWVVSGIYTFGAIAAMIIFNMIYQLEFTHQVLVHGILFFFLLVGFFLSFTSSDKVNEVYYDEKQNRSRVDEMKKAIKELQIKIEGLAAIPSEIIARVKELQENLRYVSPGNTPEAQALEQQFVNEIRSLSAHFSEEPIDMARIIGQIKKCESTYRERKQIYSS